VSSLLSYVPETVWNEDSTTIGIAAGGGGTSAHFTRPTWQSGVPGISSGAYRLLPDVALQSSIASPGYLLCSSDSSLADPTASCVGYKNQYTVAGGTSFATPIFAGLIAILNQIEHATGQGNVNPVLYSLASNPTSYAAAFHDIISGSNACVSGVTDCSSPGESGYAATPGYDEATGLGSIDFGQLVKAWPSSSTASLSSTMIYLGANNTSVAPGVSNQLQIMVGSVIPDTGAPKPSGAVAVSLDGSVVAPSLALSADPDDPNSSVNFDFVSPSTSGSHLLAVTYPGDATHAPSSAILPILVGSVTATGTFTVIAANLTVANGSQGSIPISATPAAGYSGRVAWSLAATTTNGTAEVCYVISPSSSNPNAATLTIGVGSICSSTAPAERSNFRTLASQASSKKENSSPWRSTSGAVVCAGLIACGSLFTRRRKLSLSLWLAIVLITAASIGISGCGGSGSSGGSSGGTGNTTPPPNATTYTLTLTGTDSVNTAITASTNFTLTVD
jgi:hypothetical protein